MKILRYVIAEFKAGGYCPITYITRQIRSLLGDSICRYIKAQGLNLNRQIGLLPVALGGLLATSAVQRDLDNFDRPLQDDDSPSKKGLIYARVSSSDQVDDEDAFDEGAIDDQVEEGQKIADEHGIELAHEPIKDKAKTGTDFEREGIQKVFRLAQREEVGYLITQSVDRIGRSAAETLYFIHTLQAECDVTLLTASGERDIGNIQGLMHTTLLSLMADVQNEIRTTKAKKSRVRGFLEKKNWKSYSPVIPLGYSETDDGWLRIDPEEKGIVRDIFDIFVDCETYAGTKRKINEKFDDPLDGHQVKTLLQNSVYIGKPRLPEEWVIELPYDRELDEPELQIVDEAIFNEAQQIIDQKEQSQPTDDEVYTVTDFIEEFDLFTVLESSKQATLLHDCGEPMVKTGQRNLKGDVMTHRYLCPECDEYRQWPREEEYDQMELIYDILKRNSPLSELLK